MSVPIDTRYLSTSKIANLLDINAKWLREHRGDIFQEGVHYHYPKGFRDCRWNVQAMLEWMENSNCYSDEADKVLQSLCA